MWIGVGVGETSIAASTVNLVTTLSAGALLLRPFTVLRTRMVIQYRSDQTAALESPIGSWGNIVVTEAAAAVGITAIPDPSGITGDPEADWFVWQALIVSFTSGNVTAFDANAGHQYSIDSKAMRKVGPDDNLVGVFSQENAVGSIIVTNGRRLIQLH